MAERATHSTPCIEWAVHMMMMMIFALTWQYIHGHCHSQHLFGVTGCKQLALHRVIINFISIATIRAI
eukprot:COSAG05_NODE_1444_length_4871_cov_14.212070_8_plen_68_part_00